jgi:hypothetical protein
VADREGLVTDPHAAAHHRRNDHARAGVGHEHGDVLVRLRGHHEGVGLGPVGERDPDGRGIGDDVVGGEDHAVVVDDDPGAQGVHRIGIGRRSGPGGPGHERIVGRGPSARVRFGRLPFDLDHDQRRGDGPVDVHATGGCRRRSRHGLGGDGRRSGRRLAPGE